MRYLLDTTVVSGLMRSPQRRDRQLMVWLGTIDESELATSALVVREIWDGLVLQARDRRKAAQAADYEARAQAILDGINDRILPVDRPVAILWSKLLPGHSKRTLDVGIAATARVHGLTLVTRNIRDFIGFRVPLLDPFVRNPELLPP